MFTGTIVPFEKKYEDLVTVMWVNELFDVEHPDTFSETV